MPIALGALALFAATYAIVYSHVSVWDKIFPLGMTFGFLAVACQPCSSPYIVLDRVGVFKQTPFWSDVIHYTGAIAGFASLILWIAVCFTMSDKKRENRTPQKIIRNNIYIVLSVAMTSCLLMLPMYLLGWFGKEFAIVLWIEAGMLVFGSFALTVKSGVIPLCRDKGNREA